LVAPAVVTISLGICALALGIWTQNIIDEAAFEAARCSAIGSTNCASLPQGATGTAVQYYATVVAGELGLSGISSSDVSVNAKATACGTTSTSFTSVTVTYSVTVLWYSMALSGTGCYPNGS
jgi:hypothetical protein